MGPLGACCGQGWSLVCDAVGERMLCKHRVCGRRAMVSPFPATRGGLGCDGAEHLPLAARNDPKAGAMDSVQVLQSLPCRSMLAVDLLNHVASLDFDTLEVMRELGILKTKISEFGEMSVALDEDRLDYASIKRFQNPLALIDMPVPDPMSSPSKVELLVGLLKLGFEVVQEPSERLLPGGRRQISQRMILRSATYFRALWMLDMIFERGAGYLLQHMPEGYYRCAIILSDFSCLHLRPDLFALRDKDFRAIADGKQVAPRVATEELLMLEDQADDELGEGAAPQFAALPPPGALAPCGIGDADMEHPDPFSMQCGDFVAHFDGCSHATGHRRGYLRCLCTGTHTDRCIKYRQAKGFDTTTDCAAWLIAWGMDGPKFASKAEHMAHEPTDASVALVKARL